MSVWPGGRGSCPCVSARAGLSASRRGFRRRSATSGRRSRCRVTLQGDVAALQEIDGDVMQQRGEPHFLALSRRLAHGVQSARRDTPARCPDRGRLAAVPSGEALPPRSPPGASPHCSTASSVQCPRPTPHPRACSSSAVAFMSRSGMPCRTRVRPPRFRAKDVSTCMGSPTARGSSSPSHLRREDVAFSSSNWIGTSEFDPFRSSIPSLWSPL